MGKDIKITVTKITGFCPVYNAGDSFYLKNGYILEPSRSCRVCMHGLASIMPYYVALSHGVAPHSIGLNKNNENHAFVQCLDPCDHTDGGTVIFKVEIIE